MFWRKCFYCRSRKNTKELYFFIYPGVGYSYYYHDKCIEECLCHPEDKTSKQLGEAKAIVKRLKEIKRDRKDLVESVKALCEEAYK